MSNYLQIKEVDIHYTHQMVIATHKHTPTHTVINITIVKSAADKFVKWTNENNENKEEGTELKADAVLHQK